MGIEKIKGKDGYYFRVKSSSGQIVLQSESYLHQAGVDNGIRSVKENATYSSFEIRKSKSGNFYFVMKAKNGEIIGKSEIYKSKSGAKKGIEAVLSSAHDQAILV